MGKEDLIANNPLRILGLDNKAEQATQSLGLVMARAGLGKTAILVQIAIDSMLRGNRVLHVSIDESIEKTRDRYDDILSMMVANLSDETRTDVASTAERTRPDRSWFHDRRQRCIRWSCRCRLDSRRTACNGHSDR